jgi:hypothetical protein
MSWSVFLVVNVIRIIKWSEIQDQDPESVLVFEDTLSDRLG